MALRLWHRIFLFAFLFVTISISTKASKQELYDLGIKDTLIIKGSSTSPPFEFINEKGEPEGFDVDLMRELMKILGFKYKYELGNIDVAISQAKDGEVDVLSGITFSEERHKYLSYGLPLCYIWQKIVSLETHPYNSIDSIRGKRIVVKRTGWTRSFVEDNKLTDKILYADTWADMLQMLQRGDADAMIGGGKGTYYAVKELGLHNIHYANATPKPLVHSYVVSRENEELLFRMNEGLQILKRNGTYDKIYNKWFGVYDPIFDDETMHLLAIISVAALFVGLLVIIVLWRLSSRKSRQYLELTQQMKFALKAGNVTAFVYSPHKGKISPINNFSYLGFSEMLSNEFLSNIAESYHDVILKARNVLLNERPKAYKFQFQIINDYEKIGGRFYEAQLILDNKNKDELIYFGITRDITEQILAEKIQSERLNDINKIVDAMPTAVLAFDDNNNLMHANKRFKEIISKYYNADISNLKLFLDSIYDEAYQKAFIEHSPFTKTTFRKLNRDTNIDTVDSSFGEDEYFCGIINYRPLYNSNGEFMMNLIHVRDITEEEMARRSNMHNDRSLKVLDGYFKLTTMVFDRQTRNTMVTNGGINNDINEIRSIDEVRAMLHPDYVDYCFEKVINKMIDGVDETLEAFLKIQVKGIDEYQYVSLVATPNYEHDGTIRSYTAKLHNRTEEIKHRRMSDELLDRVRVLNTKYKISIWEFNVEKGELISKRNVTNDLYHDYTPESYLNNLHPDDKEMCGKIISELMSRTFDMRQFILRVKEPDGNYHYVEHNSVSNVDEKGKIISYSFICRDITEERKRDIELTNFVKLVHQIDEQGNLHIWKYNPFDKTFINIDLYDTTKQMVVPAERMLAVTHSDDREETARRIRMLDGLDTQTQTFHQRVKFDKERGYEHRFNMVVPILDDKNRVVEYAITSFDETEKDRINQMLRFSQKVGKIGSFIIDNSNNKQFFTDEVASLFELDRIPTDYNEYLQYIIPKDRVRWQQAKDEYEVSGEDYSIILCYKLKSGRMKWIDIRKMAIKEKNGKVIGYYGTMSDVTDLQEAKLKAEKNNQLKSAFLANMSHDIRTPLNAIIGFNEVLNGNDDVEIDKEDKREMVQMIKINVETISTLITDVLDMAKFESGTYHITITTANVNILCKTVLESVRGKENNGVVLRYNPGDENLMLNTDAVRLQQVLINFMTNACKYTERGFVELAYKVVNDKVLFSVTDTGSGIPLENAETCFDRFKMLDKSVAGHGLGLHICKLISGLLRGRVYVDTSYRDGARFVFEHPLDIG